MKNWLVILFMIPLFFQGCQGSFNRLEKDEDLISKLVILRTEGLAIAEYLSANSKDSKVLEFCRDVKNYYINTQQDFLALCKEKELEIQESDFNKIWFAINDGHEVYDTFVEKRLMAVCKENLQISFDLLHEIMQHRREKDIGVYSYLAMPKLYEVLKGLEDNPEFESLYVLKRM